MDSNWKSLSALRPFVHDTVGIDKNLSRWKNYNFLSILQVCHKLSPPPGPVKLKTRNACRSLEERFFFLIHATTKKSEAICPKTKIFGKKNRFSKISVGDARKTKMAARFWPSRGFSQLS